VAWHIRGTYFESCNCDAICPCRRVDGQPGGRSTHGECMGALSWVIDDGCLEDVDISGQPVAISFRYSDDEPGEPWTWALYLDERATAEQHHALEEIFSGRLGGKPAEVWAHEPFEFVGTRTAKIEVDRTPRRQWLRVRDHITLSIHGRHWNEQTVVSCGIPGHEHPGEELIADLLDVRDDPLEFTYTGVCGFAAAFDYAG
jgi:hypothetical protein